MTTKSIFWIQVYTWEDIKNIKLNTSFVNLYNLKCYDDLNRVSVSVFNNLYNLTYVLYYDMNFTTTNFSSYLYN
jgi:competence transcription factor ComK